MKKFAWASALIALLTTSCIIMVPERDWSKPRTRPEDDRYADRYDTYRDTGLDTGYFYDYLFPGMQTNLCDRKWVLVADAQNTAADFFFFTEVPKAARNVGFVNNDLAAEFDPNSPIFGEKSAPAWIPISYQDCQGNEVARVYADEFGTYNAILASTYTMNIAAPSGVSPNMLTIVLNHPFLPNGTVDPYYDPLYAIAPWTFQFIPGTTTYTDTPNGPIASFVGFPKAGTDLEPPAGTPVISSVTGM